MSSASPTNPASLPNGDGLRSLGTILGEVSVLFDDLANAATIAAKGEVELIRGRTVNPQLIEVAYELREKCRELDASASRFVSVFASEEHRRKHAGIGEDD